MIRNILLGIGLCTTSLCFAQEFSSRIWHEGKIVTNDRDTLKGEVLYNIEANTLQLRVTKNQQFSFSSQKILFFEIYDRTVNNFRRFYAIPYKVSQDFKTPIFFEVLYEGSLTLLARERIEVRNDVTGSSYRGSRRLGLEVLEHTYFFVDKKGNIRKYVSGKKNDLFLILIKNQDKVRTFIKENRLRTDRMRDLVRITAFYNSI